MNKEEKPTNVETQEKVEPPKEVKPSKTRTVILVLIFILLFGVVLFLPEIRGFINSISAPPIPSSQQSEENQTKQRLCTFEKETDEGTTSIALTFEYKERGLEKAKLINRIQLATPDQDQVLEDLKTSCQSFKEEIESYTGIKQYCSVEDQSLTITQNIDYENLDETALSKNIGELEGFYPEFVYRQDQTMIEALLSEVGYTCQDVN